MSFLPDIAEGKLVEQPPAPKPYRPPQRTLMAVHAIEDSLLNNLGRKPVTEDFSDSNALDY